MTYLIDTQIALRAKFAPNLLSAKARTLIDDPANTIFFSVVVLWEAVIKSARGKPDFPYQAPPLRRALLDTGYQELDVTAAHVFAVADLPLLHADRFNRLLVAQARSEGLTLLTTDTALARYGRVVLPV